MISPNTLKEKPGEYQVIDKKEEPAKDDGPASFRYPGPPGAPGADGEQELYDSDTSPASPPDTYLRFERDLDVRDLIPTHRHQRLHRGDDEAHPRPFTFRAFTIRMNRLRPPSPSRVASAFDSVRSSSAEPSLPCFIRVT